MSEEPASSVFEPLDLSGLTPARIGRGRQAVSQNEAYVRDLTEADLKTRAVSVQTAPSIKGIRDAHHSLARVLVTCGSEHEASLITGYSSSRISILKADPQFQELLEFYRSRTTDVTVDFAKRMAGMGTAALEEMHERLMEKPEDFSSALLAQIVKEMADRTGHAPARGPAAAVNINVNLSDRMQRARERANDYEKSKVIDHG